MLSGFQLAEIFESFGFLFAVRNEIFVSGEDADRITTADARVAFSAEGDTVGFGDVAQGLTRLDREGLAQALKSDRRAAVRGG